MKKVGVIGCGLMGSGIAKNLIKNNFKVQVYDVNQEAVNQLVKKGAVAATGTEAMAAEVDYLVLSLPSPELIKKIILDEKTGAIHFMKSGSYILDMSTNDVNYTREMYEQAKKRKIQFFDCPLSGGPEGATTGTLTIMVGGNEKKYPAILEVLQAVGKHIEYIGESGAGQTVKLCHNMVVAGVISLLSEAFITGEKSGVSQEKLASILQKGSAQTRAMDVFGVNILANTFDQVKFSLANMNKDVQLYKSLAESNRAPTLTTKPIIEAYQLAEKQGKGNLDSAAIYEVFKGLKEIIS